MSVFEVINNEEQRSELESFYIENLNCLLNIAYSNLHNKTDAEDAVQEAFQEIVRNPEIFFNVTPNKRGAFMVAVVRNISVDMFKIKNLHLSKRLIILFAVIMCAALLTGFMLVYFSKDFHGTVYNDNTQLFAVNTENCPITIEYEYYLSDLPDTFKMVEHDLTRTDFYMRYENTSFGQVITLTQYTKNGFNTHYNTEYHNFDEIEINGHSGVCLDISNGECDGSIVIWDNGDYILEIVGNLPKNHLVDLAKSTKVLEN